jgi:hypothetical protein
MFPGIHRLAGKLATVVRRDRFRHAAELHQALHLLYDLLRGEYCALSFWIA